MEYVSTRDKSRKVSASYAIANGIAPDGGLYCPTSFPALTAEDWHALANLDYKGRSALVLGKFLTDFSGEELADYAAKAYADDKFGGADTAPVVALGGTLEKDDVSQLDVLTGLTGVPAPAPLAALAGKTPRFDRVVDKTDILSTVGLLRDL